MENTTITFWMKRDEINRETIFGRGDGTAGVPAIPLENGDRGWHVRLFWFSQFYGRGHGGKKRRAQEPGSGNDH